MKGTVSPAMCPNPGMPFISGERKQSFQFTVHTESSWNKRSDYVFAGQSEREMKEWITAFKVR